MPTMPTFIDGPPRRRACRAARPRRCPTGSARRGRRATAPSRVATAYSGAPGISDEYARAAANDDDACADGKLSDVGVAISAGSFSRCGRLRRTTIFSAVLSSVGDEHRRGGAQPAVRRRGRSTAAPAAPSASQSAACSPRREKRRIGCSRRRLVARPRAAGGTGARRRGAIARASGPARRRARSDRRAPGSAPTAGRERWSRAPTIERPCRPRIAEAASGCAPQTSGARRHVEHGRPRSVRRGFASEPFRQDRRMRIALVANPKSGTAPPPRRLEQLLGADGAEVCVTLDRGDRRRGRRPRGPGSGGGGRRAERDGPAGPDRRRRRRRLDRAGGARAPPRSASRWRSSPSAPPTTSRAPWSCRSTSSEACALARDPHAAIRRAELALAGARPFVNAAAAGLSVVAAQAGAPAQVAPRPARLRGRRDARPAVDRDAAALPRALRRRATASTAAPGRSSSASPAPSAAAARSAARRADDGLLDVAVVPAGSRVGLVRRAYGMRSGPPDRAVRRHARPRPRRSRSASRAQGDLQRRRRDLPLRAGALHAARRRLRVVVAAREQALAGRDRRRRCSPGTRATRCATAASRADGYELRGERPRGRLGRASCARPRRSRARRSRTATRSSCSSTATRSSRRWSRRSRGAKRSLNLLSYLYWSGEIAREIADALCERAAGGRRGQRPARRRRQREDGPRARPRRWATRASTFALLPPAQALRDPPR